MCTKTIASKGTNASNESRFGPLAKECGGTGTKITTVYWFHDPEIRGASTFVDKLVPRTNDSGMAAL